VADIGPARKLSGDKRPNLGTRKVLGDQGIPDVMPPPRRQAWDSPGAVLLTRLDTSRATQPHRAHRPAGFCWR
jgi:hypothetical protein